MIDQPEQPLSPTAETVKEQVCSCIDNMTEDEKADFEEMLMTLFPAELIEVDGVLQQYFIIDLRVEVDGEVRYERYGSRKADIGWILEKLYLGIEADVNT